MSAIQGPRTRPKATRADSQGPEAKGKTGTVTFDFVYTGIRVRDMAASIRFYTEVLGMEVVEPLQPTPPTKGQVVELRSPDSSQLLELNWYEPGSRFGPPYTNGEDLDHLAFECDDVANAVAELQRKGVRVLVRSKEIGADMGWKEAFVKDPNGIWIELLTREAPSKAGPRA